MTPLKVTIIASLASVIMLGVVFELIRRKRLRERYALIWILTGIVLLVLALWRRGLNTLASWVGIKTYPPSVLIAAILLFVLALLLQFSIVLSRLSDQNTMLAQKLALLETEMLEREQREAAHRDEGKT
jgi:di/tricarboxylate transporter